VRMWELLCETVILWDCETVRLWECENVRKQGSAGRSPQAPYGGFSPFGRFLVYFFLDLFYISERFLLLLSSHLNKIIKIISFWLIPEKIEMDFLQYGLLCASYQTIKLRIKWLPSRTRNTPSPTNNPTPIVRPSSTTNQANSNPPQTTPRNALWWKSRNPALLPAPAP